MPRVYETLRRAEIRYTAEPRLVRYVIRLWIDGFNAGFANYVLEEAVELASKAESTEDAAKGIADTFAAFGLNAVEVLDGDGNGSLVYPEWP